MTELKVGLLPALTKDVLSKLKSNGVTEVLDFVSSEPEHITKTCGIPYKKVLAIRRLLLAQHSSFPVSGVDMYEEALNTVSVLPTGCGALDRLLCSGIYTGEVTEFTGPSCCGKTQLCETWALNIASEFGQNVLYIDNAGSCSARRMADMFSSKRKKQSLSEVLSRIKVARCCDIDELMNILTSLKQRLQREDDPFCSSLKAIVVDSITAVLMPSVFNGPYVDGQARIQRVGRTLNSMAKDYALAIVTVNDMVCGYTKGQNQDSYFDKPALGATWSFVPSVRVILSTGGADELRHEASRDHRPRYTARLQRSSRRNNNIASRATFAISPAGVVDS